MSESEANVNYREEILRLVAEGKIKHTTKYVEKASDETWKKFTKVTLQNNWTKPTNTLRTRYLTKFPNF